jgi:hypothetical protein
VPLIRLHARQRSRAAAPLASARDPLCRARVPRRRSAVVLVPVECHADGSPQANGRRRAAGASRR